MERLRAQRLSSARVGDEPVDIQESTLVEDCEGLQAAHRLAVREGNLPYLPRSGAQVGDAEVFRSVKRTTPDAAYPKQVDVTSITRISIRQWLVESDGSDASPHRAGEPHSS